MLCSLSIQPMKYRVYVCTAAPDRAYAKMVWKQLDPDHILIPKDKIEERLFNGHSLERLDRVAGLGTYGTQPGYPTPDDGMPMAPMMFIVDDKVEVRISSCT